MRLFVALAIPEEVKARLGAATAPLREQYAQLRWTRQEGWHVTLAFLGTVADDTVGAVRETIGSAVETASPGPIELSLAAAGHFGRRVLWLGLDDEPPGAVAALGGAIQQALRAAELPCDDKPVHPHVTLARPKGRRKDRLPAGVVDRLPEVSGSWAVQRATLYCSHLGRGGATYEALCQFPL